MNLKIIFMHMYMYDLNNKLKKKKYQHFGTFPKYNRKVAERSKIDTPNTHIHDHSLSCLGTGTSITSGGVKLVPWTQPSRMDCKINEECVKCFS